MLGPIMLDVAGYELTAEDRNVLCNPHVGGVILFSRNFKDIEQLENLVAEIKLLRNPQLIIAVDHEGGRVQRFREGFTHIPPMRKLGELYLKNKSYALSLAIQCGWLLAAELLAVGIDFSFTPVVDLDYGVSSVIGDRSFNADPIIVSELSTVLIKGMHDAGMSAVAKHFPGHGAVVADSHTDIPVDDRELHIIEQNDIVPFMHLINQSVAGIMPAHVIYPKIDDKPAGFSNIWLQELLRHKYHFQGTIFSDDLDMAGASAMGNYLERAQLAINAGCDVILICNNRGAALSVLAGFSENETYSHLQKRWEIMRGKSTITLAELQKGTQWNEVHNSLK
jgi:beta-N-acetylhexosaminidase